jgi:hypothetical protein
VTIDEHMAAPTPNSNYGKLAWAAVASVLVLKALIDELKRYNDAREAERRP